MRSIATVLLVTSIVAGIVGYSVITTVARNEAATAPARELAAALPEAASPEQLLEAIQYVELGNHDRAIQILDRIVGNADVVGLLIRGTTLRQAGLFDRATADLDRVIEIAPSSDAYTQRAFVSQQEGADGWAEATVGFAGKAIELTPDESLPRILLGNALVSLNRLDESMTEFKLAIQINPNSYSAYAGLARVFAMQDQLPQARKALRRARSLCENQSELDEISWVAELIQS